jgi:RNA polymerase sigma-70 factor (ECF subfamily)
MRMNDIPIKEITNADNNQKDRELVRQIKQGCQSAFTELVSRYQKNIFKLAYGFFQDRDDAMEIVQETFIRLYEKLDGFDENNEKTWFKNWVNRIAYNLCIDFYRKFKKKKADMKELYEFNRDSKTLTTREEDQLDHESFRDNIKKSVRQLPKKQQTVFVLKHYQGLKHQEISIRLNLSVGTIKTLYHRSIKNLKKCLVGAEIG